MKRKINKGKIVVVLILIIAIIVGITTFIIYKANKDKQTPEDVLKQYMSYIEQENYEGMYELLTEDSKNSISKEDYITRNKNIYEGIEAANIKIENVVIEEEDKTGRKITYDTTMDTAAGQINFSNTVHMLKTENKTYNIKWSSKVIYPGLADTDKIKVTTLSAERGQILDRNGKVLAGKGSVYSVGFVPGKMSENKEKDIETIAQLLDISVESINKALSASYVKEDTFVPLKKIAKGNEELENKLLEVKGIKISTVQDRVYPLGNAISHLIGYVQSISAEELKENEGKGYTSKSVIGKSGLEKIYEDRLKGTNGCEIYVVDENGNKKSTIAKEELKNGEDIKLTIDSSLQQKVYNQFKEDNSANVAINPKTGEVLALVSTPSYDSNDFVLGMSTDKWNKIQEDANKPLYNRYQSTWVPGSSLKPIIAAIGLTTGKIDANENYGKSGLSWQKDSSWGSYNITTLKEYGDVANLRNALVNSDNIYFAKAALKIGADTLAENLLKIGFDKDIPFEQGIYKSQFATDNKFETEIQLADTGYGQGKVLVNPIHMASIYSAFVNDGNMIKPYLEYKDNKKAEYLVENAFSKEAANIVKEDLIQVVEDSNGTAHSAKISGMTIAGKTGTAEIKASKEDTTGTEIGWFNAFRVTDNANNQLLVISMVENVKEKGGSHYLLPKVKAIFN